MRGKTEQRTTQLWTDGMTTIEQRRIEDHDCLVKCSTGTPWLYVPRGPYAFQMFHETADPMLSRWCVRETLWDAVNEFARWALPPRIGWAAEIVDESFRQVLCGLWSTTPSETHGISAWDLGGAWFGCRAAFEIMHRQQCCDDVSLAIWEGQAMSTAPGSGFNE